MPEKSLRKNNPLKFAYNKLYGHFGPQGWWPGKTRLEIIVGAILTQNTSWSNVEKAIVNLKRNGLLDSPRGLRSISKRSLARLIRPAGYYNIKATRLKNFINFLFEEYKGNIGRLGRLGTRELSSKLITVNGIGPETRDSILLYAFGRPVFVVDAYTKRFLSRHGMINEKASYDEIQRLFMHNIRPNKKIYNEYHALIVQLGKKFCRKKPRCTICALKKS